jgi:hypothetical protein
MGVWRVQVGATAKGKQFFATMEPFALQPSMLIATSFAFLHY